MGFVAKREVGEWPFLGSLIQRMNTLFVNRECTASRVSCLRQLRISINQLCYCIFPQGTTSDSMQLQDTPWFAGQIFCRRNPGVRVFAVGLSYYNHKKMAWIDNMTLGPHLWWVLKQPRSYLGVAVKEVEAVVPRNESLRPLSEQVRSEINRLSLRASSLIPASPGRPEEENLLILKSIKN